MRIRWFLILLLSQIFVSQAFTADGSELQVTANRLGAVVTMERVIDDGKVLLSVSDADHNPVFGLTKDDFIVMSGRRSAKIISAQPVEETLEVPRNFVLVLDNSYSMYERYAIEPLLEGVGEFLKIVRPIDKVHIVVFSKKETEIGGRRLHVLTFNSNDPAALKKFVADAYHDGITSTTVLYEAMLEGLDFIRTMPANEPRFVVVFSDGEDINSSYKSDEVFNATEGLGYFNAYAIDFMPGPQEDKFLKMFAEKNHGQLWKAKSETNLVPIFQNVASKMQYHYVVSYLFPTTGSLTVSPSSITIDEIVVTDTSRSVGGAPAKNVSSRIDASEVTLHPMVDTAYSISKWKAVLTNANGIMTEQAATGALSSDIVMPLKTDDLGQLANGGDIKVSMEVQDSKGQNIVLTAQPVKVNRFETSGSLTVTPSSLIIEEIKTIDASPMLGHIYFSKGSSDLPAQYVRLAAGDIAGFDEQRFRDTLEKYYQVLNIIGKRMTDHPDAVITLTGCNDNTGLEKGNIKLATARAETIRGYLQTVWGLAPERLRIEARNLPKMPSSPMLKEGQADNRRVEITSDNPAITDLIKSVYPTTRIDTSMLTFHPAIKADHGVAHWTVTAANNKQKVGELAGEGIPPEEIKIPLNTGNLNDLAISGDIRVSMEVLDSKGQKLEITSGPVKINFLKSSQLMAQKQDFRVQEKYALILFDFDRDTLDNRNHEIVNTIVARIKSLPQATVDVVGHTDNIGKEGYNIKLSERRALAVYKLLREAYGEDPGERLSQRGVGPNDPLYDNATPEARAFNRTVTIILEYVTGN